jgi:hypothetical protein
VSLSRQPLFSISLPCADLSLMGRHSAIPEDQWLLRTIPSGLIITVTPDPGTARPGRRSDAARWWMNPPGRGAAPVCLQCEGIGLNCFSYIYVFHYTVS